MAKLSHLFLPCLIVKLAFYLLQEASMLLWRLLDF
jgi:hypothetical protein